MSSAQASVQEFVPVPRSARLRFPLVLDRPQGFVVAEKSTWPAVNGRLEFFGGRLWFMPPCGEEQQYVSVSITSLLLSWARTTNGRFRVGGNEAGMLLGGEVRGADAAVFERTGESVSQTFARRPPVLAVEVAGRDESEPDLRDKARWYLRHGVKLVWLVLPARREVLVLQKGARARRLRGADVLPESPWLPGLRVRVRDCFEQL
jgi:Uma2 family endonuclease